MTAFHECFPTPTQNACLCKVLRSVGHKPTPTRLRNLLLYTITFLVFPVDLCRNIVIHLIHLYMFCIHHYTSNNHSILSCINEEKLTL